MNENRKRIQHILNGTFKNGQDSKFYIMCILPQLKKESAQDLQEDHQQKGSYKKN